MSIFGLVGTVFSGIMAQKAAKTQASAVRHGIDVQDKQYEQSRDDMMPWLEAGKSSLKDLQRELGTSYEESEGYQWAVDQAETGIKSNLAALGMSNSGSALKRLSDYRMGAAQQDYDKWYDRKANLASGGQQQSTSMAALGSNYANSSAKQYNALGEVEGSGYAALGNLASNYVEQQEKKIGYGSIYSGGGDSLGGQQWYS